VTAELHPRLRTVLENPTASDSLVVIIELPTVVVEPRGSRSERTARAMSAFRAIADPVKAAVERLGGEVIDEAWINSTIKCRIPATALNALAGRDDIKKIDLPRSLAR
jgi:hypothetical protein